jgi:hypothetical protein
MALVLAGAIGLAGCSPRDDKTPGSGQDARKEPASPAPAAKEERGDDRPAADRAGPCPVLERTVFDPGSLRPVAIAGDAGSVEGIFDSSTVYPAGETAGARSYSSVRASRGTVRPSSSRDRLDPRTWMVYPFPVTPAVRNGSSQYLLTGQARRLRKRDVVVRRAQVAKGPMSVAAIVFPRFAPGPSLPRPMSPGQVALELLRQCRNFERHREGAVRAMSALAETVPAWALSFIDPGHRSDRSCVRGAGRFDFGDRERMTLLPD